MMHFVAEQEFRQETTQRGRPLRAMYSPQQVRWVLARERARADRNGHQFSVVVFRAAGEDWRPRWRLARVLCQRARVMDEVGWFDENRICAILPFTETPNARCFARAVCHTARAQGIQLHCGIYSYPSRESTTGCDDDRDCSEHGREHDAADEIFDGRRRMRVLDAPHNGQSSMRSMPGEVLFVQTLPGWKRTMDVMGALFGLLVLAPVMTVAALLVKLTSKGPVFFRQRRAGLGGRPFTIYKFRTMVVNAEKQRDRLKAASEQDGPAFKITHDPRVTRIGRWLRATSIDELPQLINVLKGDMSLVGPRPLPLLESDGCAQWQRARLDVTPGLTCIWQVWGRPKRVKFDEWQRMDIQYIRSRSFWKDMKILLQTVPSVLFGRGAC